MLASIQQRVGFEWRSFEEVSGSGAACFGMNHFAGQSRPVEVPMKVRLRHTYVAGATGYGKSKLIERLAVDDVFNGVGFCLVDPHGDVCLDVLSRIPEHRMGDVVYISFGEAGFVPRWNPFKSEGVPAGKLADDMARAFLAQASTTGPRMEHNFRMLAYVVHELGGTLDDFAELAGQTSRGSLLREQAVESIVNPQAQRFLRSELPRYSSRDLDSVTNKLSRLLLDDQLGAMFRQRENTLHPRAWMDESKIVLVNLSSGYIGDDHARFVGSLLVSLIYRAALTRAELPEEQRRPFILYLDEFQKLQTATLKEILSEGRKYGLGAVLAHQERGQLGKELAQALGNCATKVLFRPGEDDVSYFKRLVGGRFDDGDFRALGVGQAVIVCGSQLASLTSELCKRPRVRDARRAVKQYAEEHYFPTGEMGRLVVSNRPRVYDTFGGQPGESGTCQ